MESDMIKFTVASAAVREMSGVGKTSQKPYHLFFQTVYAHTISREGEVAPFPEKIEIMLDKDERTQLPVPYSPGEYQLHPSSFYVDREGRPAVSIRLTPLRKPA